MTFIHVYKLKYTSCSNSQRDAHLQISHSNNLVFRSPSTTTAAPPQTFFERFTNTCKVMQTTETTAKCIVKWFIYNLLHFFLSGNKLACCTQNIQYACAQLTCTQLTIFMYITYMRIIVNREWEKYGVNCTVYNIVLCHILWYTKLRITYDLCG